MRPDAEETLRLVLARLDEMKAEDTLTLVSTLDRPGVRMMLDLYHAQIGEGNLIETVRTSLPWVGEIQVADVPGEEVPEVAQVEPPRRQ